MLLKENPAHHPSMPLLPILMACGGGVLLGVSPLFVRASDLGPMTTGFYRLLIALPFLWIWMKGGAPKHSTPSLTVKDHVLLALGGSFFALDLAMWNWSLDHTAIVNATLFNNTAAFFVPLFMLLFFGEKPPLRFIMASLTGFFGCILLAGESFTVSFTHLLGDIIALLSGIMVTLYVITIKKIRDRLPTGLLMFWTTLASLVGMGLCGILFHESFYPLTPSDWISAGGQGLLVHVIGQGMLAYAMGRIPPTYGALVLLLAPVTAAVLGWSIYGEALSFIKLVGISIIMISLIAARPKQTRKS